MSELERAVEARIAAYRPDDTPPFERLRGRRRGAGTAAAVGVAALVAAVIVVPVQLRGGDPVPPPAMAPLVRPVPTATALPTATGYELWRARGSENYTMRFSRSCFCPQLGPVTVTVVSGRVVSPAGRDKDRIKTIDQLFTLIRSGEADRVEAAYDPEYGYPRLVDADMMVSAIDDEVRYRVTDYRPLPPP